MTVDVTARRRRVPVGCIVVGALGIASVGVVSQEIWPADEVSITVLGMPPDTSFYCLVSDAAPHPVVMNWYVHKIDAVPMHPDQCVISEGLPMARPIVLRQSVEWLNAARVGVLRQTSSGEWLIAWFESDKSPVTDWLPLIGRGEWHADLERADATESVSPEAVRAMGISRPLDRK